MRRIVRALAALAVCAWLVGACEGGGSDDSSTHWLRRCAADSDCDEGLVCRCGLCTVNCEHADSCSPLGAEAICRSTVVGSTPGDCRIGAPVDTGLCLASCTRDDDCASADPSLVCALGGCVPGEAPIDSRATAPGGDAGASGGGLPFGVEPLSSVVQGTGGLPPGTKPIGLPDAQPNDYGGPQGWVAPLGDPFTDAGVYCQFGIRVVTEDVCFTYSSCRPACSVDADCRVGDEAAIPTCATETDAYYKSRQCLVACLADDPTQDCDAWCAARATRQGCELRCTDNSECPVGMACVFVSDVGSCMWPSEETLDGCPAACEADPPAKGCPGWCAEADVACDPSVPGYCCDGLVCGPDGWCVAG